MYHFDFNISLTLLPQLAFGDHIHRFSIVRNVVRITFPQKRRTEIEVPGSEQPLLEEDANVRDKGTLYSVETVYHYYFSIDCSQYNNKVRNIKPTFRPVHSLVFFRATCLQSLYKLVAPQKTRECTGRNVGFIF